MPKCLPIKKNSSKIFPKCTIDFRKECCICLSKQFNTKKCTVCKSGIICTKCQKKLPDDQRSKCPVCRSNTDAFIIEIRQDQNSKRNKKNFRCTKINANNYSKCTKLLSCNNLAIFTTLIFTSYGLGLIVTVCFLGIDPESMDHFLTFLIGLFLIGIFSKCFHCCCCGVFDDD